MYIRNLNCPKEYILSDFFFPTQCFYFIPQILSPETVSYAYTYLCATYNICMYVRMYAYIYVCMYLRMYAYLLFFHDWKMYAYILFSMYTVNIILFGLHQILIYESDRKALWREWHHWGEVKCTHSSPRFKAQLMITQGPWRGTAGLETGEKGTLRSLSLLEFSQERAGKAG